MITAVLLFLMSRARARKAATTAAITLAPPIRGCACQIRPNCWQIEPIIPAGRHSGLRRANGRQEGLGSIGLANANQANLAAQLPLDSVEPQ